MPKVANVQSALSQWFPLARRKGHVVQLTLIACQVPFVCAVWSVLWHRLPTQEKLATPLGAGAMLALLWVSTVGDIFRHVAGVVATAVRLAWVVLAERFRDSQAREPRMVGDQPRDGVVTKSPLKVFVLALMAGHVDRWMRAEEAPAAVIESECAHVLGNVRDPGFRLIRKAYADDLDVVDPFDGVRSGWFFLTGLVLLGYAYLFGEQLFVVNGTYRSVTPAVGVAMIATALMSSARRLSSSAFNNVETNMMQPFLSAFSGLALLSRQSEFGFGEPTETRLFLVAQVGAACVLVVPWGLRLLTGRPARRFAARTISRIISVLLIVASVSSAAQALGTRYSLQLRAGLAIIAVVMTLSGVFAWPTSRKDHDDERKRQEILQRARKLDGVD